MKKELKGVAALLTAVAFMAITLLASESLGEDRQFSSQAVLSDGTPLTITVVGSSSEEGHAESAISSAVIHIKQLDSQLFMPGGLEAQMNSLPKGQALKLSPEIFSLLEKSTELSAQTKGFFDIAAPSPKNAFSNRDWRRIALDGANQTISFKSDQMRLDLRRIAKGFFADVAVTQLARNGFPNVMVEVDSVTRSMGHNIFTPWSIVIGFGSEGSRFAHRAYRYNIKDIATATITPDGLARELIDGKSKNPVVNNGVKSLTIFANDAATALAFGLAVYTRGPKYGMKYIDRNPAIKGIMVDNNGLLSASAGLNVPSESTDNQWQTQSAVGGGPNDLQQKKREEAQGD